MFDPLGYVTLLQFPRLNDGRRVTWVLVTQVQVMCAVGDQHGNEAVRNVLSNPACKPRIQKTVAVKREVKYGG